MSDTLRCGITKEVSTVDDMMVACQRILHILQKDGEQFTEHVNHVSNDVRSYAREQKDRLTDDATVRSSVYSLCFSLDFIMPPPP